MPFPSPGDLPDPGIEPGSPALQADALLSEPPYHAIYIYIYSSEYLGHFALQKKLTQHCKENLKISMNFNKFSTNFSI